MRDTKQFLHGPVILSSVMHKRFGYNRAFSEEPLDSRGMSLHWDTSSVTVFQSSEASVQEPVSSVQRCQLRRSVSVIDTCLPQEEDIFRLANLSLGDPVGIRCGFSEKSQKFLTTRYFGKFPNCGGCDTRIVEGEDKNNIAKDRAMEIECPDSSKDNCVKSGNHVQVQDVHINGHKHPDLGREHDLYNSNTQEMTDAIRSRDMSNEVVIPGQTVIKLVEHWGSTADNSTLAFVSSEYTGDSCKLREINRKEILDFATRFAHRLKSLGIQKGDIVCNSLPNSLERVVCEFGILFCGAVSMNGQIFRADGEDFLDALRTSECLAVIVDPKISKGARDFLLKEVPLGCEKAVKSKKLPKLQKLIICSRDDKDKKNDFLESLRVPDLPQYTCSVSPSDLATIMTTSGSTGYSKLVKLTHANICHFGLQVKAIEPLAPGDHFINCAPLGWAGGYPQWYLSCGVTRYFLDMHNGPPSDLPVAVWKTIVQNKIKYGFLSPMYVNSILTNKELWQNSSWKPSILCLAGQPIKKELLDIIGKLCDAVDINYGLTECNLATTHRIVDPSTYTHGCAGYPGYGVKIKVVDQNKKEVPQGETGEILIWSPSLFSGYLNNEIANKSSFTSDGWFCTDDSGYIKEDGKLYVEGRQSDSILRGAYILYPGWLEKKMREVPSVKDIAVVAVPDPVLHNEICACVVVDGIDGIVSGRLHKKDPNHTDSSSHSEETKQSNFLTNLNDKNCLNSLDIEDGAKTDSKVPRLSTISEKGKKRDVLVINDSTNKQKGLLSEKTFTNSTNGEVNSSEPLLTVESELREFTDGITVLHKNDAMRMVPKYYVFFDKFPVTNTGKISRKEIHRVATSALGLGESGTG